MRTPSRKQRWLFALLVAIAAMLAVAAVAPGCALVATFDRSRVDEDSGADAIGFPGDVPKLPQVKLTALVLEPWPLTPAFDPEVTAYSARYPLPSPYVSFGSQVVTVTAVASDPNATMTIAGRFAKSGERRTVDVLATHGTIDVVVIAADNSNARTYKITLDVDVGDYLKASNTRSNARFGSAIAISGTTIAIGAREESSNATGINGDPSDTSLPGAGAAYVFVKNGSTWTQQAYVKGTSAAQNEYFGSAVALSGDTLAVGAPGENRNAGAVRIFRRTGSTWVLEAYLQAPNPRSDNLPNWAGARYGAAIALDGNDMVIGAPEEPSAAVGVGGSMQSTGAPGAGAAYHYFRAGTVWSFGSYLKSQHTMPGARFGESVALQGIITVGSEIGVSDARGGAVYAFTRNGSSWKPSGFVEASNPNRDAQFGAAISLSNHGALLAVGAPHEPSAARGVGGDSLDTSAPGAGAAYIYDLDSASGTFVQSAYIKASNTRTDADFGHALALDGDVLAVGAWGEPSNATGFNGNQGDTSFQSAGAAYVFRRKGGTWTQSLYVKATNPNNVAFFGDALALSSNLLVVGALGEKSKATGVNGNQKDTSLYFAGAVYVY